MPEGPLQQDELGEGPGLGLQETPRILDAHIHVGAWPRYDLVMTFSRLKSVMDQFGYGGAVVTPALLGDPLEANAELLKQVLNEEGLYFFAWIHPGGAGDGLLRFLRDNAPFIRGLKFHPSISQMSVEHPWMRPYLEFADRHRMPLLYHCGRTPVSWADPVKRLAPSYPRVPFIVAHLGGNAYDRVLETMHLFPDGLPENVYVESSTARHPDLLRRVIDHYGRERVMFGTDLPFTDMRMNWACVHLAGLDKDEDFLGANLARLLKDSSGPRAGARRDGLDAFESAEVVQ